MNHIRENLKVTYKSKDGTNSKEFDAVDFISSLVSHIPNKCEQMVSIKWLLQQCVSGQKEKR